MEITIIYSNPHNDMSLESFLSDFKKKSNSKIFDLSQMNLKYCTGCWSCWYKTPGKCSQKDGIEDIYRSILCSDLLLFVSPLLMGSISAELKQLIERLIPLIHPYMAIVDKEIHHKKRYKKYPRIAAFLGIEKDTDDEDRELNKEYFSRLVKNFYSRVKFIKFSDEVMKEVSNELLTN